MTVRWDQNVMPLRRTRWLGHAMTMLSLDVTRACADDLGLEAPWLDVAQPALRSGLAAAFQALVATSSTSLPAEQLIGSLPPEVASMTWSFYDRVLRYSIGEPNAHFCWDIILMRCAQNPAVWSSLPYPRESSEALREAFWASMQSEDIQRHLDEAFARPLSTWDGQVAVLRLLPPEDEGEFGLGDQKLRTAACAVRKQRFWRGVAELLGEEGLRALRLSCQAFLETQADLAPAFGQLFDPWLLAHPEITSEDPLNPGQA
jgi:hypothetical protein